MSQESKIDWNNLYVAKEKYTLLEPFPMSEWKCYMFGNKPEVNVGIVYQPSKGQEPNWFVRWMMKICFDCTWVKEKK